MIYVAFAYALPGGATGMSCTSLNGIADLSSLDNVNAAIEAIRQTAMPGATVITPISWWPLRGTPANGVPA